jgi:putative photosynthetic complex assembly protein
MSQTREFESFPRGPLFGAAFLVTVTLSVVGVMRATGHRPAPQQAPALISHDLRFEDLSDGGIAVYEATGTKAVDIVAPGTNGFLRGTLRGLARERKLEGVGQDIPFRLSERTDGHLLLEDPATHRLIDLGGFGPTNAAAFASVLQAAENAK